MSREHEGLVLEQRGEYALVMPTSHTGCDSAHCCQGSGVSKVNVEMVNTVGAGAGEKVIYTAKEANMLKAAFIVYALPIIMIVIGAVAGSTVSSYAGLGQAMLATIGGILAFILSVLMIKRYDNFASNNRDLKPVILRRV